MEALQYNVPSDLAPFLNCILFQEDATATAQITMPLYADGYPGIMYQQTSNGFYLLPKGKKLSELFLYGQTLDPIALECQGPFRFVVFQLYPFASKYLLGVDPKVLNDDCYDLLQLTHLEMGTFQAALHRTKELSEQVAIIYELMRALIAHHQIRPDDQVQQAIAMIIERSGQVSVKALLEQVPLTERTLERRFAAQVGMSPKQFARIIQFQASLSQLSQARYDKLLDVGLDSGFADQSHFIRTFKKYTGQTPSFYLKHHLQG